MLMQLAANPVGFFKNNPGIQIGEPYVADALSSGWLTEVTKTQLSYRGDKHFDLDFVPAPVLKVLVRPAPPGAKSPTRFLPFRPDCVSWMRIDPTATTVYTAQLSGCNMYVSTIGTDVWLFHTNANTEADDAANARKKRSMAEAVRTRLGGTSWDLSLERGVQPFYQVGVAAGIFFGQKVVSTKSGNSAWGFYLYTPDGHVHRIASSVGATNATL